MKKAIIIILILFFFILSSVGYNIVTSIVTTPLEINNENLNASENSNNISSNSENNSFTFPNAIFTDIDGNEVAFEDFFGKPLVVNLWASWCGPCKYEMPDFQEAYNNYGDDVHFIMISLQDGYNENMKTATDFINSNGYNMPFYFDTKREVSSTLRIRSIPTTFFINKDGSVNYSHIGLIDASQLNQNIISILNK